MAKKGWYALSIKINIMAKVKGKSSGELRKISFGKRKKGSAKKAYNKHNPRPKKYKGQGR